MRRLDRAFVFANLTPVPQSLSSLLVHLVFSTKNRQPWLSDAMRDELHAYVGGTISHERGVLLKAGSVADHIRLLIPHPRTIGQRTSWRRSRPLPPNGSKIVAAGLQDPIG